MVNVTIADRWRGVEAINSTTQIGGGVLANGAVAYYWRRRFSAKNPSTSASHITTYITIILNCWR